MGNHKPPAASEGQEREGAAAAPPGAGLRSWPGATVTPETLGSLSPASAALMP